MDRDKNHHLFIKVISRPETFLIGTFAVLILAGALLLCLPVSHGRNGVNPLDALFTATSAVCVTGLIVVDTGQDFSRFGQIVILLLIQLGGLGIMTFAVLVKQIVGGRISFRSQAAMQDVFYQRNAAMRFRQQLRWLIVLTLGIETVGATLLFLALPDDLAADGRGFVALFHAVSAFCNAGFSTFSDNLVGLRGHPGFMTTIAILIILGGLGYTVLFEIITTSWRRLRGRESALSWSLNTRVVIATSACLIVGGWALLILLGLSPTPMSWSARAGHGLFQSITTRTAGFNTIDLAGAPTAALLWVIFLMFIGGSPGSCAGGVKTTSLAVWVARLKARLQLREDVTIGNRRIPVDLVRRTGLLLGVAVVYNLIGVMVLSITETGAHTWRLEALLVEQFSAFGTVGLSTGVTPYLTAIGKLWIILTMFVGRLGPLTIALAMIDRNVAMVRLPEERLMIG